eukprot:jgi/Mesen1/6101/ME000310S05196
MNVIFVGRPALGQGARLAFGHRAVQRRAARMSPESVQVSSSLSRMLTTLVTLVQAREGLLKLSRALSFADFFTRQSQVAAEIMYDEKKGQLLALPQAWPSVADCAQESIVEHEKESAAFRMAHGHNMIRDFRESANCEVEYRAHHFINSRGEKIFTQVWTPGRTQSLRAVVVVLHGLNEHSGRYAAFAKALNARGYGVFCMDWIGHGCSDGLHGYVERLDHVLADARLYLKMVTAEHPDVPAFFFGHSTGGAIALKAALQPSVGSALAGVIMTSPAIHIDVPNKYLAALAPVAAALIPRHKISRGATRPEARVSRDPAALLAKYSDPLVYTGGLRARTGWEVLSNALAIQKRLHHVTVPFLVMHGSADKVTEPSGSQALFRCAPSLHKRLHLYEGLLHDLLFEPEKDDIICDIIRWMEERLQAHCA